MVRAYIDDVLIITKNKFKDHMKALDRVLQRITEVGFKVNTDKFFFEQTETGYLGFWVRTNGVRPLS